MSQPTDEGQKPQKRDQRRKRQAEALRANLRRRKAATAAPVTTEDGAEDPESGSHSPHT